MEETMSKTIMRPLSTDTSADVGILIGRWQVHELHEAHLDLIETVRSKHDRVIIFVGLSPLKSTAHNPLDFNSRRVMIQEAFPDIEVYYVSDNASHEVWSKNLDREIDKWLKPHQTAVIYGSRDSFIPYYSGKFTVQELEATKFISGTEIRRRISNTFHPSKEFRAGVISASLNRYPTCYPTVDVAILDRSKGRILMGKKDGEEHFRFIGGFAQPDSLSFEADAKREVIEETGIEVDNLQYIGSALINDWRYYGEIDKIKTMFFVADYVFGRPEADDDIAYVEWVPLNELISGEIKIMPEHEVLVDMLAKAVKL
jgi:bifunctional NMN adenylyltransferase/nudix hydrolase